MRPTKNSRCKYTVQHLRPLIEIHMQIQKNTTNNSQSCPAFPIFHECCRLRTIDPHLGYSLNFFEILRSTIMASFYREYIAISSIQVVGSELDPEHSHIFKTTISHPMIIDSFARKRQKVI